MKTLDKGQDKIKKIAESIKQEVLEPAHKESEKIIEEAQHKADEIIGNAEKQAQKLLESAKQSIEHERNVFHSSLSQSALQTLEHLRQNIETKLFNEQLEDTIVKHTSDPQIIADLITAIIEAIEREGLSTNLSAIVPKNVSPRQINQLLAKGILEKLQDQSVAVGNFAGGAQVKLVDKQLTLDVSDESLLEYLRSYLRKDFRKLVFAN
jgi:V/A-type H+-transporting ATPase subunit E